MSPGRVIYNYNTLEEKLPEDSYIELGSVEGMAWGTVSDETLVALLERPPAPPLLYFSRAAYERAVEGLASHEVYEVIVHRLEQWAPRALDEALNRLYRQGRRVLQHAAQVQVADTGRTAALQDYFGQTLHRLAEMVGQGRYDEVAFVDLLVYTLEGEAELIAEYERAQSRVDEAFAQRLEQWVGMHKNFASVLGQMLAQRGRPEYAGALPYRDLERVFWVQPRDEELMQTLALQQIPFAEWKGGVVVPYPIRKREALDAGRRSTKMLYFSTGVFLEHLQELTQAQQERDYAIRLEQGVGSGRHTAHLATLALEQILMRMSLQERAHAEGESVARKIEEQLQREREAFRWLLASVAIWGEEAASAEEAVEQLRRAVEIFVQDAALLATMAQAAGRHDLHERLKAVQEALEEDRARLFEAMDTTPH